MKKKVSALLAAGMAASLLVGCGGGAASSSAAPASTAESTTSAAVPAESTEAGQAADITLWTYPIGKWGDSDSVNELLADFNAQYPDIHVTVEYLDYTNGDDQVNTAIEGASAHDLGMELPASLGTRGGAERRQNFLKAVQAVYDSGKTDVGAIYCSGQGGDQGTRAIINNMYGGTFTDAAHTKYTADSAENIKAIQALYDQDGINFDASINGGEEITLFRNGTLQMAFCWNIAQQTNSDNGPAGTTNSGDDILFMAFPTDSGDPQLCGGIWGFGIFDNGDENKIAASKTFIDFMANSDETAKAVKTSTYFSVKNSLSDLYKDDEIMSEYQKLMPYLGDYYQVVPGWAEARTAWWNMLQQVGSGADVTTAVNEFCTTANAAASAS